MKPSELLRRIPNSDQSPLYDVRNPAAASVEGRKLRSDVSRTMWRSIVSQATVSPSSPKWATPGTLRFVSATAAPRVAEGEAWWSQTGSNRRPHACKARALPAELWPQFLGRRPSSPERATPGTLRFASSRGCATRSRRRSVVGLGRLELPTSRLSSARSNQLSYKPLTTRSKIARVSGSTPLGSHNRSPWRVFVREERET